MARVYALVAVALAVSACRSAAAPASPTAGSVLVVLVRHAEAEPDGTRDPGLSAAGRRRADDLALSVYQAGLEAVYATEYRRTQETARAVAARAGLDVTVVPYGSGPVEAYAERLAAEIRARIGRSSGAHAVLVVGHSNTTPALAQALLGSAVPPIAEDEYGRTITIVLTPEGAHLAPPAPAGRTP